LSSATSTRGRSPPWPGCERLGRFRLVIYAVTGAGALLLLIALVDVRLAP